MEKIIISVQFSHSVVSYSLRPHGLQHARLPYPSPTPRACSNSCPLSRWCHPTISSSVVPFSSCLQSLPTLGSFPMSLFFASGSQSVGVSASASEKAMMMNFLSEIKVEGSFKKIIDHNQDLSPNRFLFPTQNTHTHSHHLFRKSFQRTSWTPLSKVPFLSCTLPIPTFCTSFTTPLSCGQSSGCFTRLCPAYSSQQCQPCSAAESDLLQSKKKKKKLKTESSHSLSWSLCWSQGMGKQSLLLDCPPEISFCELGLWALKAVRHISKRPATALWSNTF